MGLITKKDIKCIEMYKTSMYIKLEKSKRRPLNVLNTQLTWLEKCVVVTPHKKAVYVVMFVNTQKCIVVFK